MRRIVLGLVLVLSGCAGMHLGPPPPDEDDLREQASDDGTVDMQKRAQFDLQCPKVQVLALERAGDEGPATLVGAQGCGQQAQYQRRLRRSGWSGNYVARNAGPWTRVRPDGQLSTVVVARDP